MKDQAEQLRQKLQQSKPQTFSKSIAVVSGKGGVGKSNYSINFAIALANMNKRVLIIDSDIGMGNINVLMGVTAQNSLHHYLQGDTSLKQVISTTAYNVDYIAGGSGMASVLEWSQLMLDRFLFAFEELHQQYDYILFDMGAGATEWSLQLLMAIEEIVVVTTTEPTSITDAYSMMKYIHLKDAKKTFSLVANRALSTDDGQQTLQRLKQTMIRFLGKEIQLLGVIPEDLNLRKAVKMQQPFTVAFPKTTASKAIFEITRRYIVGETMVQQRNTTFITKLKTLLTKGRD